MTVKVLSEAAILGLSCCWPLSFNFGEGSSTGQPRHPAPPPGLLHLPCECPVNPRPPPGHSVASVSVASAQGPEGVFCRLLGFLVSGRRLLVLWKCTLPLATALHSSPASRLFPGLRWGLHTFSPFRSVRAPGTEGGSRVRRLVCLKGAPCLEMPCRVNQ